MIEMILAHLVGDYILQSDWMANEKTKVSTAAAVHAFAYTLPFLFITNAWPALLMICVTHFIIDRWRLARYVCWLKNFMSPRATLLYKDADGKDINQVWWRPWSDCSATGYLPTTPTWMSVWLLIIADNTLHLLCNYVALRYLT